MKELTKRRVTITVKRPDGNIDIVDATAKVGPVMSENFFITKYLPQVKTTTKDAGRGEVIGYEFIEATYEDEESDHLHKCERCGRQVDDRTAYHQIERTRFGGQPVNVTAYYCDDCAQLLGQIGAGEYSALEEKAHSIDGIEMIDKETIK